MPLTPKKARKGKKAKLPITGAMKKAHASVGTSMSASKAGKKIKRKKK